MSITLKLTFVNWLGYILNIPIFAAGEATPEQDQEIGRRLAAEVLQLLQRELPVTGRWGECACV